ncbi:MAG: hypothetical protein C0507_04895 [Cyanobacteria bacterium PR.3.49]|nr:hypothetical protein [Cyanobacteria bacterium PR.3.49]
MSHLVRTGVSAALAFCLLCPSLPALAAESDEPALAHAETILFGEPSREPDMGVRLARVEKRIFGRKKGGTDEARIERITSTLLIDRKKLKIAKKAEHADAKQLKAASEPSNHDVKTSETATPAASEAVVKTSSEPPAPSPAESFAQTAVETVAQSAPAPVAASEPASHSSPATENQQIASAKSDPSAVAKAQEKSTKKGKKSGKMPAKNVSKGSGLKPLSGAKSDTVLASETPTLDARKAEKPRSAAHESPATSSSPNRISRSKTHKSSQATALLREGMEAHRNGDNARAEHLFKRVVLIEPRNPDGYFNLGALAEKKNDLAGALMSYRAALNLSPRDRELLEAVESLEAQIGVVGNTEPQSGSSSVASPSASATREDDFSQKSKSEQIREYYARQSSGQEAAAHESAMRSSDRFEAQPGEYGFRSSHHSGHSAHNGPAPAPNFYRARAKTTREIQEEAAGYMDVNDANSPELTVSTPQTPVANTSQPQPFQLQTQRNQATTQATQNRGPSAGAQLTRALFGIALSVGTNYALRSAGVHCPVCRIGGGAGPLRSLLRF